MPVTVTYELQLFTGQDWETVPEAALDADLDSHRDLLSQQAQIEGAIVLEAPQQPRTAVEDELGPAVQNLCFSLPTRAAEGESDCLLYGRTNAEGIVVMVPAATQVRLIGDEIPTFRAPMAELLPALHACGVRYLALLDRLGEPHAAMAEHLRPYEARARTALGRLTS